MTDDKAKSGDTENISIKGVQKRLYERVKGLATDTGRTVGELTNDAFKVLLSAAEETKKVGEEFIHAVRDSKSTYVQDLNSIEISGPELVRNNKKVTFKNIKNLVFKDLNETDFENYVESIVNVKSLEIPKGISKFKVLERSKYVDNIKFS
ncbi:MAG: hypothetical protein M0Z77_03800 [Thermoplasmatales archaeon]|jgi:hypothetical protein|nr:hypothetical protein [Candidatus Thermoplasmatota archaeon]MCL6003593.1 hypothetical protein [Candidatus Thermoplasmatota archaeon]MDA8054762.1 hypothetical protein [Thermoplasmatales archaeon]